MRANTVLLAAGLALFGAAPALAARPDLARLPSAVRMATPGTGSAPVLSAGVAGAPALAALTEKRQTKRPRLRAARRL